MLNAFKKARLKASQRRQKWKDKKIDQPFSSQRRDSLTEFIQKNVTTKSRKKSLNRRKANSLFGKERLKQTKMKKSLKKSRNKIEDDLMQNQLLNLQIPSEKTTHIRQISTLVSQQNPLETMQSSMNQNMQLYEHENPELPASLSESKMKYFKQNQIQIQKQSQFKDYLNTNQDSNPTFVGSKIQYELKECKLQKDILEKELSRVHKNYVFLEDTLNKEVNTLQMQLEAANNQLIQVNSEKAILSQQNEKSVERIDFQLQEMQNQINNNDYFQQKQEEIKQILNSNNGKNEDYQRLKDKIDILEGQLKMAANNEQILLKQMSALKTQAYSKSNKNSQFSQENQFELIKLRQQTEAQNKINNELKNENVLLINQITQLKQSSIALNQQQEQNFQVYKNKISELERNVYDLKLQNSNSKQNSFQTQQMSNINLSQDINLKSNQRSQRSSFNPEKFTQQKQFNFGNSFQSSKKESERINQMFENIQNSNLVGSKVDTNMQQHQQASSELKQQQSYNQASPAFPNEQSVQNIGQQLKSKVFSENYDMPNQYTQKRQRGQKDTKLSFQTSPPQFNQYSIGLERNPSPKKEDYDSIIQKYQRYWGSKANGK